jgi:hypothetical protein
MDLRCATTRDDERCAFEPSMRDAVAHAHNGAAQPTRLAPHGN